MKKKMILFAAIAAFSISAATVATVLANRDPERIAAKDRSVDFSSANITRRVWFVNNDNWWNGCDMYVHVWNDAGLDVWNDLDGEEHATPAHRVDFAGVYEGDYHYGLYYADLKGEGVGGAIKAQVKLDDKYEDVNKYTVDLDLPSLASKGSDVIWLNSGLSGDKRNASVGCAPAGAGQIAKILLCCLTCDDSFAYGFNAYPQLDANFLTPSKEAIDAYGDGCTLDDFAYADYKDNGYSYGGIERSEAGRVNILEKIAAVKDKYDNEGWVVVA